jgi:hypothetical protein
MGATGKQDEPERVAKLLWDAGQRHIHWRLKDRTPWRLVPESMRQKYRAMARTIIADFTRVAFADAMEARAKN